MCEVYRIFSRGYPELDFSEEALRELFESETFGGKCPLTNGYAVGKKWLNVTLAMWLEDIKEGNLFKIELYEDPLFENYHWWLDSIFKNKTHSL